MKGRRLVRWDNVKAFLICCVVFGHAANPFRKDSALVAAAQFWVYLFHMPAFVYTAGVFSKRTIYEKHWLRAVSYLLLYLLMKLLMYAVNVFVKGPDQAQLHLLYENNVPWFALAMFWFLLITMLLQKVHPLLVIGLSVLLGAACGYRDFSVDFLAFARTIVFYPFFYLGFRTDPVRLGRVMEKRLVRMTGILVMALSFLYVYLDYDRVKVWRKLFRARYGYMQMDDTFWVLGGIWRVGAYLISGVLVLALLAAASERPSPFTKLGERTLPVYAFHFPLLVFFVEGIPFFREWMAGGWVALKCILLSALLIGVTHLSVFDTFLRKLMKLPETVVSKWKRKKL